MHFSLMGFVETFFLLLFALGWGILELVGRHLDRQRKARSDAAQPAREPQPPAAT